MAWGELLRVRCELDYDESCSTMRIERFETALRRSPNLEVLSGWPGVGVERLAPILAGDRVAHHRQGAFGGDNVLKYADFIRRQGPIESCI